MSTDTLSLQRFATICAAVEAGETLTELLAREKLSFSAWLLVQARWLDAMAAELDSGGSELNRRFLAACESHRRSKSAAAQVPADTPTQTARGDRFGVTASVVLVAGSKGALPFEVERAAVEGARAAAARARRAPADAATPARRNAAAESETPERSGTSGEGIDDVPFEEYALVCAELSARPEDRQAVLERHQLAEDEFQLLVDRYAASFRASPSLLTRFQKLHAEFLAQLQSSSA